jgi:hypothetical protein
VFLVSPDHSDVDMRLSDLRRGQPADSTTRNLLVLMTDKLELCARLPVYEHEAASEGHARCAEMFSRLAEVERKSFNDLLTCLRGHIDVAHQGGEERPAAQPRRGWR